MLKVLVVLLLIGHSMAETEPVATNEQTIKSEESTVEQSEDVEQRTHNKQTIVIVKPTLPPLKCGPNEVYSNCVTPCQPTCEFPKTLPCPEFQYRSNAPMFVPQIIIARPPAYKPPPPPAPSPCSPGCLCAQGFVRNEFGHCIPISYCPPLCKRHSHFERCGPRCQPTCEFAEPRGLSVCTHDKDVCVSGCFCDAGYVKDLLNGQCVRPNDCSQICPENEHYSDYGVPCTPSCQNRVVDLYKCSNYTQALPGCYCDRGFLRDWTNKRCVREYDCPPKNCPAKEEWYKCKPCTPTCSDPLKKCPLTYDCQSGCDCKKGYIRNRKANKCIPLCECPQFVVPKY